MTIVKPPISPRHSPEWLRNYAVATAAQKNIAVDSPDFETLHGSVQGAFRRVFRAVAFDIDGTLTKLDSHEMDPAAAHAVANLLQRGVHVFLVTGRGPDSTLLAARFIRDETHLSAWYLRRLACVALNGVLFLATTCQEDDFLGIKNILVDDLPDHGTLIPAIQGAVAHLPHVTVERKIHSVRIVVGLADELAEVRRLIEETIAPWTHACADLCLSSGKYGPLHSLSLSRSNKRAALELIAKRLGISSDLILRIGDQGQEGGNDYELLDSSSGFSVGGVSQSITGCFPVFDDDFKVGIRAAEATRRLTSQVNLLPSISLSSEWTDDNYRELMTFEKLAVMRSREEDYTTTQRLQIKLRYLLGSSSPRGFTAQLRIDDIFDPLSGAVRFRDWEFLELPQQSPATIFFSERLGSAPKQSRAPHLAWSMYSDTGRLLRGPNYYYGLSRKETKDLTEYFDIVSTLIDSAQAGVASLLTEQPTLGLFKLLLAYADNLRNAFIQIQHLAFLRDLSKPELSFTTTSKAYRGLLRAHTAQHFRILLNPDWAWRSGLQSYAQALVSIRAVFESLRSTLLATPQLPAISIRNWRESDHFLQNVAAVQLGLHEFLQRGELLQTSAIGCGLVYGGTELPAIAQVVGQSRSVNITAAFAQLSIYGSREVGEKVRSGDNTYIEQFLLQENRIGVVGATRLPADLPTLILDDNVTTGATLQLARDLIVVAGGDVIGSIIVGFPGSNRSVQMQMDGHVDPDLLFGFIRGLVAPSPYARLLFPANGPNKWVDQTGMFNKAKTRIERYVSKNVSEENVREVGP